MGFLVYYFVYKLAIAEALLASFFLRQTEGNFATAYDTWTQGIIFGVTFSLLFQNILEKYNPERSCRMLAKDARDHILVVGYSHLGRRLVKYFRDEKTPYCLIERERDLVADLLREGEPVIVDDARETGALDAANVGKAKAVLITSNNLDTALLVTKRARDGNKACPILTRCFQDEFVEILEALGANDVISCSRNAFADILTRLKT